MDCIDYQLMDRAELEMEFCELLYWLWSAGCECIEFKEGDCSLFLFPKDVNVISFSAQYEFEK